MTVQQGVKENPGAAAPGTPPPGGTPPATGVKEGEDKTVPLKALQEERDKRQTLQSEVENLKVFVQQMQHQQPPQQAAPPQYGGGYQQQPIQAPAAQPQHQIDQLWEQSPKRAVQAEIMAAMNWYDSVNAGVDRQEAVIGEKFKDFSNYREPVRQYLRTIPMQQRMVPGVVEAAYYFVKGQNADKLVQTNQAELIEKIKRGEAVQGFDAGQPPSTPLPQTKVPTEEQKKVATAMGLSVEDYMGNVR